MKNKIRFEVVLEKPDGVSATVLKKYICEAIDAWKGCYCPDSPLFNLKSCKVKLTVDIADDSDEGEE